jgi:hypothetical protein
LSISSVLRRMVSQHSTMERSWVTPSSTGGGREGGRGVGE